MSFQALMVEERGGQPEVSLKAVDEGDLSEGDVLVAVAFSSLNYKDALAVTGKGKIIRRYPMIPGIDLAGIVEESGSAAFKKGDPVIVTGCGLGEIHWGGYAQKARVPSDWTIPLPEGLDLKRAMAIGTAGFTAMLCIMALEEHGLRPGVGEVVVTGASGGVGSIAVAVLSRLGHAVAASTGRASSHDYLRSLGAARIVERAELSSRSKKGLESERWTGAVDTVGGDTLAMVLKQLGYGGSVAACGLAGGTELQVPVFPFILRAVNLLGINSSACSRERRTSAWRRVARELPGDLLDRMTRLAPLKDVPKLSEEMLKGGIRGRTVVDVHA